MATCKYNRDDICVNADCPYVADYCPVFEDDSLCKFNVSEEEINAYEKLQLLLAKTRKDTAKEILQELFDEATSNVSETVELTTFQIEQFANRFGVEVE